MPSAESSEVKGVELRSLFLGGLGGAGQGRCGGAREHRGSGAGTVCAWLEPAFSARVWSPGPLWLLRLQPSLRWARGVFGAQLVSAAKAVWGPEEAFGSGFPGPGRAPDSETEEDSA